MMNLLKKKIFSYIKRNITDINFISDKVIPPKSVKSSTINITGNIDNSVILENSVLLGNILIEKNVVVKNSSLKNEIFVGKKSKIVNSILSGIIEIGDECKIVGYNLHGNIKIGRYTSLWGPNSDITTTENIPVKIGNFCSIARNVSFQSYNHNKKKITTYFIGQNIFNEEWHNEKISDGEIIIGNDVWIGAHTIVLGNVNIGHGAIIAANTLVNKDVPPYAIVGGTPGKILAYRFSEDQIAKLLAINWWDWSIETIKENKHLFENELNNESLNKYLY